MFEPEYKLMAGGECFYFLLISVITDHLMYPNMQGNEREGLNGTMFIRFEHDPPEGRF